MVEVQAYRCAPRLLRQSMMKALHLVLASCGMQQTEGLVMHDRLVP